MKKKKLIKHLAAFPGAQYIVARGNWGETFMTSIYSQVTYKARRRTKRFRKIK